MGLFGFVGKALGKIAKVGVGLVKKGASAATGGISDVVLDETKKFLNPGPGRVLKAAALDGQANLAPRIKVTERAEGWNFSPTAYGGYKRGRAMGKPRAATMGAPYAPVRAAPKPKKKAASKPKAAPVLQAQRARTSTKPKATRTLPPALRAAAEKSKALAAQWRALGGQQGTGQTFFAWKVGR